MMFFENQYLRVLIPDPPYTILSEWRSHNVYLRGVNVQKLGDAHEISAAMVLSRKQRKFLLTVIAVNFDPARLMREYEELVRSYALRHTPRADGSTLRSISLTHRPGASEPLYDGNNTQYGPNDQKLFLERDFTEFNKVFEDTGFYELYQSMPFRVGRMRLNLLPSLTVFTMHRDSAPRAHVVLDTNADCFLMSGDAQTHHVPADGSVYIFDTTLPHTALNASRKNRIHITMALADEERL